MNISGTALGITAVAVVSASVLAVSIGAETHIKAYSDRLEFKIEDKTIGVYQKGPRVAKPYLWPVFGPGEIPLTRAWPMEKAGAGGSTDHPHQKSMWFCHGDVIPDGVTIKDKIKGVQGVDFWSETPGHGKIVCTRVQEPENQKERSSVVTFNIWCMADGTKMLDEKRIITVHNFGTARLMIFDIDLVADEMPITFGDTKEGSFGVRVNDELREVKGNGRLENAEGKVGEKACWGQLSAWCDYSGTIGDQTAGIAIFDDPSNPNPACWHSRGYGLMAANPFGRAKSGFPAMRNNTKLAHLGKGEHLHLRYGLLLHQGDAKTGHVNDFFERFAKLKG